MNVSTFFDLCKDFDFPLEACNYLKKNYETITNSESVKQMLISVSERYSKQVPFSFWEEQNSFENACSEIGVHPYAAQMIFYLYLSPILKMFYHEKGFDKAMFDGVKAGIRCKLFECYDVYGIYGSFVAIWFARFFTFSLFAIGRLEFAPYTADFDFETIKKGEPMIDVHIPSRGKLIPDEVNSSYLGAIDFFNQYYQKNHKGFICDSWLLYPKNRDIIPECKNVISFMDYYKIAKFHDDPSNDDLWRIFGSSALTHPEKPLFNNTYMQKQFKAHIEGGGSLGIGIGIHIINNS